MDGGDYMMYKPDDVHAVLLQSAFSEAARVPNTPLLAATTHV
tara:strand:+ start:79 stop:204 length:126 start_codon:yes stop_codon:yes gene_type:complete